VMFLSQFFSHLNYHQLCTRDDARIE